jgi:hypothetical protein
MRKDIEQHRVYTRQWRLEHAEELKVWRREYRRAHTEQAQRRHQKHSIFVDEQKVGKCCIKCGEADITKLDFHHRDPATKLFNISSPARPQEVVLKEIEKCDLLCRSCHMKHHNKQRRLNKRKLRPSD